MSATRISLLLLCLTLLSGCSTFDRDWQAPAPADGLAGRWQGRWVSDLNGHEGELRAIVTRLADDRYQARYRARYWKVMNFEYTVEMTTQQREGELHFEGQADLGFFAGGVYTYKGTATDRQWLSTYESKFDHGRFEMEKK